MTNNRTYNPLPTVVICALLVGCSSRHEDVEQFPLSGMRAIYLQAREEDKITSGEFGDLWMLELKSNRTYRLTDDYYYDASPVWFVDGRSVLFLSNRVGSWSALKIKGVGPPHELYRMWFENKRIARVDEQLRKLYPKIINGYYWALQWHPDGKSLLFRADNSIYRFSFENNSAWKMVTLDSLLKHRNEDLRGFTISPDTVAIVIETLTKGYANMKASLGVYRFSNGSLTFLPTYNGGYFGGWSLDRKKVLITGYPGSLRELEIDAESLRTLIEADTLFISPYSASYIDEKAVVFLGGRRKIMGGKTYEETEIMHYDILEKRVSYLTEDGKYRSDLTVSKPD